MFGVLYLQGVWLSELGPEILIHHQNRYSEKQTRNMMYESGTRRGKNFGWEKCALEGGVVHQDRVVCCVNVLWMLRAVPHSSRPEVVAITSEEFGEFSELFPDLAKSSANSGWDIRNWRHVTKLYDVLVSFLVGGIRWGVHTHVGAPQRLLYRKELSARALIDVTSVTDLDLAFDFVQRLRLKKFGLSNRQSNGGPGISSG
ncbi:hypothetical protein C8J57DRAFT_1229651 [Mycena rebaudengoi]|nr:hypothetical protein C8J57DRAFT_1229651 [Mycena rebaudengoi]